MIITLNRTEMVEALKKLSNVIDGKTSTGILKGVKVETAENSVILTAGNVDTFATVKIEAVQITTSGASVLPFKLLNDFLKKSKADFITLESVEDYKVKIEAANINYKLMSDDTSAYPITPELNYNHVIALDVNEYRRMIKNTVFAVAKSDSRPVLKGVNIRTDNNNKLHFVATDSHRLGKYMIDTDLENVNYTPDGKSLEKSVKMLNKTTESIVMSLHPDFTVLSFDNVTMYIKNIDGNYPDTSRLIPIDFNTSTTINSKETLESLDMLQTIAKEDRNNVVNMSLNGKVELSSNSPEIGEMNALLNASKQGEDLNISYSALYMTEALKALDEKEIDLRFSGAARPFIATAGDQKALHLILPVRLPR